MFFVSSLLDFFFPRRCAFCGKYLVQGEETLCLVCQTKLPRIYATKPGNEVENRLFGRIAFQHATSFCYYNKEGQYAKLLQDAKYHDRPWINYDLTRLFASELNSAGWPYDIDLIVPVPIHWMRRIRRGYNQSEPIARALSRSWNLPVECNCFYKKHYTRSQVGKSREDRLEAEQGSFGLKHPERLVGKHVLLVDDVFTTGSTLESCAAVLEQVPDLRLSVLTLGMVN